MPNFNFLSPIVSSVDCLSVSNGRLIYVTRIFRFVPVVSEIRGSTKQKITLIVSTQDRANKRIFKTRGQYIISHDYNDRLRESAVTL